MKVALAIASLNGDPAAGALALRAMSEEHSSSFCSVGVIDSGDERRCQLLEQDLSKRDYRIAYRRYEGNLGSAGNLVARLRWGAEVGAEAVMAVNADGVLLEANVRQMIDVMARAPVGAVYPTHVIEEERVDLSGLRAVPILPSRVRLDRLQGKRNMQAQWGSSNGALYRLLPLAEVELDAIADLWYGWEDLALGIEIGQAGYQQVMSVDSQQPTKADQRHLARTHLVVSSKAPWTTYYGVRNLLLIARRHSGCWPRVVLRTVREFVMVLLRDRRRERYRYALRGTVDGLRGRSGQVVTPTA